jgi:predicted amidohydrolase YtcJ
MLVLISACKKHPVADRVVHAKIWTADESLPWAEAFAVVGDSIAAIGTKEDVDSWIGENTKVFEGDSNNLIVPGFIDCHTHFMEGGYALSSVHLKDAMTPKEFIERIKAFASKLPKGAWITNGDWDNENWGGLMPTRDWIDSVTQDNPVWINRYDGHMCLANTAALEAAGLDDNVQGVAGGSILRDKKGRITGALKDNAMELVYKVVPEPTDDEKDKVLLTAMNYVTERGVTSVHNVSGYMDVFERARKNNALKIRVYAGMMLSQWRELDKKIKEQGRGDKWLRIGGLKEFVDGSLGSHTAAFFKPFTDSPKDSGFFITPENVLYSRIKSADSAALQVMTHAIGDKAIHTLLDIYEKIEKENGNRDRRFRIEHAQHIHPDDIPRFAQLDVIPSMQPYHAIDDGRFAEKLIGYERCKTTYAFKSLLDANAKLAFGSDWFVAPPTPIEGIYAAVTRRTLDDKNPHGWIPEQKISVEEALKSYTIHAAYASFEDNIKGSLKVGKLADYVILEENLFKIDPVKIRDVKIIETVVGGKTMYSGN